MTSLMGATQNGHIEDVKLLLEQKGIDVNPEDLNGKTAIILAAEKNRTKIFEMLKNHEGIIYDEQFIAEEKKQRVCHLIYSRITLQTLMVLESIF